MGPYGSDRGERAGVWRMQRVEPNGWNTHPHCDGHEAAGSNCRARHTSRTGNPAGWDFRVHAFSNTDDHQKADDHNRLDVESDTDLIDRLVRGRGFFHKEHAG